MADRSRAETTVDTGPRTALVDVHHHFVTPRWAKENSDGFLREIRGMGTRGPTVLLNWQISDSLEAMDKAGVATSMLSLSAPGPWLGDAAKSLALCRHCNDHAATAVQDHPGRFGHFASLPLPDVNGCLQEISYALDTLHADGFIMHTNDQGKWLGDSAYWPVYEELDRRSTTVFIHALLPECCGNIPIATPPALLEYPFDTARAISNWIFSGAAVRFPKIKFIFPNGGGAIPMVLSRLDAAAIVKPELARFVPNGVPHEIQKFHFDTTAIYNPVAFAAVRALMPRSQILFGSDAPFVSTDVCVEMFGKIISDRAEQNAIGRENALALFPRYA